jgi:hypothetical protein
MPPDLEAWCYSLDPDDEESFHRHPVLHQQPMSDQLDLIRMQLMGALVTSRSKGTTRATELVWP